MCVQSYAGKSESRWCDAANAVRNWIALIQQVFAHCKDFPRWILNPPQARKLPRYSLGLEILRNSSLNIQVYWLYTLHIFFVFFFKKKDSIPSKKKINLNHHWCHGLANATTSIPMAWTFDTSCGLCKAGRCCNSCCGSQIEICTFFVFTLRIKSWGCSFTWLSIVSNACLCLPNHLVRMIFSHKGIRSKKWPNTYWLCCWLVNFQHFVSTDIDTTIE